MALQLTHKLRLGQYGLADIDVIDAYHRITAIHPDFNSNTATIQVATFKDKQARLAGLIPVDVRGFEYNNADITRAEAYNYLKTLPEFNGATDV